MKLELLFNMLRDTVETCTKEKRDKLKRKFPDVDISELHRRIINYQIKKYGKMLSDYQPNTTYEDYQRIVRNKKDRRKQRLYGKPKRKI